MNKKIVVLLIFILIIGIVLAKIFIFYDKYKMPKGAEINVLDEKIAVYEETNLYDLLENYNITILTEDTQLNYNTIGNHTYTIKYKYNGSIRSYLYDVKYTIVDEVDPIFINVPSSKTFYVGEASEDDLTKKVSYADNYDSKPTLKIEGDVDFENVGTYNIKYIVTDQSGNETIKNTSVVVKERPTKTETTVSNNEEEEDFVSIEEQIENYKTASTMIGIDVSKWQGDIDFEKVKNAGVEFVILRMGVMKDKDTPLAIDNTFESNYNKAKEAGLKVGIYVYSEADTVDKAVENAKFVIDNLNGDKLDFPVCFDWENWAYFNELEINLHRLNEMYDAFTEELENAGYTTMLYASENYLNNTWLSLKDYTIWAAKYSSKMPSINAGNEYILWQNTDKGRVDGIEGNVDLDIYYK